MNRTMNVRRACNHWADRPILRDFFWFLVLPHRLKLWIAKVQARDCYADRELNSQDRTLS